MVDSKSRAGVASVLRLDGRKFVLPTNGATRLMTISQDTTIDFAGRRESKSISRGRYSRPGVGIAVGSDRL